MNRIRRTLSLSFLAVAAAGALPGAGNALLGAQAATVTVHDAWVREAPAGRKVTAAFLVAENPGKSPRSIVSATSDAAETVELHEMKQVGSTMEMSPVKSIEVPAGGKTELKPGGLHVMMFGLKKPLAEGDTVMVTLVLDNGTKVNVAAQVRKPKGM